jgi:Tol biopolymer transport system component/DNA-binding winged helix-turn-helix (wHTH) protein
MIETEKPLFYEFADFRVDAEKRILLRGGKQISLTPKVFELLLTFLEQRGDVLEKEDLMNLLWADSFVEESNLAQNVAVLRKALGESSKEHKFILTVPGRGYRFVADVKEIFIENESAQSNDVLWQENFEEEIPALPQTQKHGGKWLFAGIAVLALLVIGIAFWFFSNRNKTDATFIIDKTSQLTSSAGLDIFPSISTDGNTIAFSSDRSGNFEIYVKQLVAGAREVQITSDGGQNFQPAFSPDGTQIAYYSKKRGGVWLVPVSGGKPKQLTEFGSRPSFSPDGLTIVFQTEPLTDLGTDSRPAMPPSTIWTIPATGGEPTQITKLGDPPGGHGAPSFSPDGKRIVFSTNNVASSAVWTVSAEGGDLKHISDTAYDGVYAPDGKSILTFSGRMLLKINISETEEPIGEPMRIAVAGGSRGRYLAVASKSKRIVYSALSINSNLWATPLTPANEAAGNPIQLTQNSNSRSIQPAFSPDGKKIAFQSADSTGTITEIWLMDSDGKNPSQLTSGGGLNPGWFPDGSRIAFIARREDKIAYWSVTVEGGKEKKLFDFGQDAIQTQLSPDGKQVVFNSTKGETINVWMIPIEGGEAKQLTFDKEMAGFPYWSPDGKWLSLQIKRGGDANIAVMPSEGGEITQLTFDKGLSWLYDWSPDGDKIVFAGQRDGLWNIYWVSRSTKEQKQLTHFTKLNSYVRYPGWSPLNDQIVYEYAETTGNIWMIELK